MNYVFYNYKNKIFNILIFDKIILSLKLDGKRVMKKLFKEVWKSFSKSKIILGGLTFLVFLTSGILTLIFDVVKTYNTQYDEYKRISRLHDLTLNSNIEPTGTKPNDIYVKDTIIPNIWSATNEKNSYIDSIRIDTKWIPNLDNTQGFFADYINLKTLNYSNDTWVNTKDLSYLLNSNINNIKPNNGQMSAKFNPNKDQNNELRLYDNLGNPIYNIVSNIETIHSFKNKKWVKTNKFSDLYNQKTLDFNSLLVDTLNPTLAYIEDDVINSNVWFGDTKIYDLYASNPSRFLRIESSQVAKWFGFSQKWEKIERENEKMIYFFDPELKQWIINEQKPNEITSINILLSKTFINNFDITLNNAINSENAKVQKTMILDKSLTIPKQWFIYSQEEYKYERFKYNLNGIGKNGEIENSWSGIYYDYLTKIKTEDVELWNKLQKTSYWKKTLINKLVDFEGNQINEKNQQELVVSLTKEDLTREISNNGNTTTILTQEGIAETNDNLPNKLNTSELVVLENIIETQAKEQAYKMVLDEIKKIANKIGLRENITINSNTNKGTEVFQFINVGNRNKQMMWNGIGFEQEVGKLINSTDNSKIFSLNSNINVNEKQVPQDKVAEILDKLLTGLSLNRDYINPMISFQTFTYNSLENQQPTSQSNAKIIWLTTNLSNNRQDLIGLSTIRDVTTGKKEYFVLKEKTLGETDWYAIQRFSTFEQMKEYVETSKLNFAPFDFNNKPIKVVSDKGWVKQNVNYSDLFSIPFQYLLPSDKIIEEFNTQNSLTLFTNNLVLKLTQNIKPLINPTNWNILMNAVNTSFSKYGFGEGLTPPAALTNYTISKIVIGALRDASVSTNQNYLNILFTDLFDGIKRQIIKYGQQDIEKQKEYLVKEIEKIEFMLKVSMGITIPKDIIKNYISDPIKLINSLNLLINSLNLDNILIQLFDKVFGTYSNRAPNQIISTGDYLPIIYANLKNEKEFKNGLVNLISSINLEKLLNDFNLGSLAGIITPNLLNLINIEKSSIGASKLIQNTKWIKDDELNVVYKSVSPETLLNLFSVPLAGGLGTLLKDVLPSSFDSPYDPTFKNPLELDLDLLWFLQNYLFANGKGIMFEVDAYKILSDATEGFTQIRNDDNQIVLNENIAKIAMVNEAYLKQNNKEVYYSSNLEEDLQDLSQIDEKYKIQVSNVEYVITGTNLTVDYMYPVLNNENIQVNPKSQALVYVNQYGFDRIKRSHVNSPMDKYFLLTDLNNKNLKESQTILNQFIYKISTNGGTISSQNANLSEKNPYKKAFLYNEYTLINPERSMRLSTIDELIKRLDNIQKIVGIILSIITAIVISFVVRRYISSRAKVIGILKAQGYSSLQIAFSICLFSFIVSLIGGTLGYIAGHFSQLGMFNLFSLFWTMPISVAGFNWITLVMTILVPFFALSLLTIFVTLWFLRKNPISLMNGSLEVNDSKTSKKIKTMVQRTSIKNKFSISLSLSSIGKLLALFISVVITSCVTLFSVANYRIFNKSIDKTYQNRNYSYKTDLISPTIEGGDYANVFMEQNINQFNKYEIDNMLYVPIGVPEEGYTYIGSYFKPGYNPILNKDNKNGILDLNDTSTPHIFTKSSIDLTVLAGGLSINVWSNLFNTIPESQRASIITSSQDAAHWLKWTQEGKEIKLDDKTYITRFMNFDRGEEYLTLFDPKQNDNYKVFNLLSNQFEDIRIPYFNYVRNNEKPEKSHFEFRQKTDNNSKYFDSILIIDGKEETNKIRKLYRDFLVSGYKEMILYNSSSKFISKKLPFSPSEMPRFALDYFIMPGANSFGSDLNGQIDETYTYIETETINKEKYLQKIYGYETKSKYVKITDNENRDLLEKASQFKDESEVYPLIINEVTKQKYNLSINDILDFKVNNHYLRYQNKLKDRIEKAKEESQKIVSFKIIGISNTYINEEWITTKQVANKILGLNNQSYNGIFTNSTKPIQLTNSLSLYAPNGYWSAQESIQNKDPNLLSSSEKEEMMKIYEELFYKKDLLTNKNISLVANNIRILYPHDSEEQINEKILNLFNSKNNNKNNTRELNLDKVDPKQIYDFIELFSEIYTNKALQSSFVNSVSNGVEKDFVLNASNSINDGMTIVLAVSFAISLTILVMISTMIINENERNIATFGILGYKTKEKIRMFFSIYIPIVILAIILSSLIVWALLPIFAASILATSSIALPLNLSIIHVLITTLTITTIFTITCIAAWMAQGRINPIILLKGE